MAQVAIIFHSGIGHTAAAAEAIQQGVASVDGAAASLHRIQDDQITEGRWSDESIMGALSAADAIVFGAPTYMGMVSWQFKAFAGGFTASGFPSGDKVVTLHYLATLAAQLRMIWVGPSDMSSRLTGDGRNIDQWGYYLGVGVVGGQPGQPTNEGDLATCTAYGARLAQSAMRWSR
jgi:NAD(P)H dehydrogenase (quinone)